MRLLKSAAPAVAKVLHVQHAAWSSTRQSACKTNRLLRTPWWLVVERLRQMLHIKAHSDQQVCSPHETTCRQILLLEYYAHAAYSEGWHALLRSAR
jgi:hypothetical protein